MSMTSYESEIKTISSNEEVVFTVLSDLSRLESMLDKLPTDKVERSPIELPPPPPGENGEPEKKPSESPSAPEGPASIGEPPQEPGEGKIGGKEIN